MFIVDTHVHASSIWFEPVETLLYEMNANGVGKALLVQFRGNYHNDYLFECIQRYPGRFAACVAIDTAADDAPSKLDDWARKGAAAVRMWIAPGSTKSSLPVWRKAGELGLAVSVLGTEEELASDEFRHVVEMFPHTRIVIEHYGHHGQSGAGEQPPYDLYRRVLSLADYPSTYMKLGGLGELCDRPKTFPQHDPFSDIPPFAKMAVDAFGPRRLMFGSDFPPVAHREGYRNALMGLMDHLSYLKQEDLQWIFGQTALQVWRFPKEQAP
ncbi:MAG: amidohydrolase family protein [Chloroflexi bacterium]|nr:amidohydrolase family protein [Chloroflexota bacterium]